jgi:hypothetical protein
MGRNQPPPIFRDDTDATITSLFRKGYDSFRIAKMLGLDENRVLRITRALELQKQAHPETFVKTTADTPADPERDEAKARRGVPLDGPASRNEKKIPKG